MSKAEDQGFHCLASPHVALKPYNRSFSEFEVRQIDLGEMSVSALGVQGLRVGRTAVGIGEGPTHAHWELRGTEVTWVSLEAMISRPATPSHRGALGVQIIQASAAIGRGLPEPTAATCAAK